MTDDTIPMTGDAASTPAAPTAPLTAEQRSAAFSGGRTVDRTAALQAGRTPVPRRVVAWIAVGFVVIGLGGVVIEHYFGNVGVPTTATTTTISPTAATAAPPTPSAPAVPEFGAPLASFIGLKPLGTSDAPDVQLTGQSGAPWSLHGQAGKVVVLTFYSTGCTDICPVLGQELRQAAALLGTKATGVEFVIVNTDPHLTALSTAPPAITVPGLDAVPGARFLTGPLPRLNAIWIDYGVAVTIGGSPPRQAHNDILYFVDPEGRLRSSALPFANEDGRGAYTLPASEITRFAQGIAQTAASLTTGP